MPVICFTALLLSTGGCGFVQAPDEAGSHVNTLRSTTYRLRGFDPAQASDVYSSKAVALVYETLVGYAYASRPYQIAPALADLPEVSDDGLVYTFHLRQDAVFPADPCFGEQNGHGRSVTADDVVYSFKRIADPQVASPGFWIFDDRIVGLNRFRESARGQAQTDYSMEVAGLRAVDAQTVQLTLLRPFPQLLWVLTMSYAAIVPHEAVTFYGPDFLNHPVGSGPYVLAAWRRNHSVLYTRKPVWRRGAPGERFTDDPAPAIDRLLFSVIDDATTRWLAFLSGQLDLSGDLSRDNWDAVIAGGNRLQEHVRQRGIRLQTLAGLDTFYIGFNMDDPVVGANRALRLALTCAFDTEAWLELFHGRMIRAKGPIPPDIRGYCDAPSPYPFDLDRAKAYLREAGYPDGIDPVTGRRLRLTLELGRTDVETRESTELLVGFMDRIGIVLEPSYNNWPAFLDKVGRRQAQMFRIGWIADYPDGENFLQLFYGPNASPGPNRSNYNNPEFDRRFEQARVMPDSAARTAMYQELAQMVVEDAPWIFMYHRRQYVLHHERVTHYIPHHFPYGMERHYRLREE